MSLKPSQLHRGFTDDRLIRVADILRRTRDSAAKGARWGMGDTPWSIGCVAFERAKFGLATAAKDLYSEWMSVSEEEHCLLVKICMVPLRFYRGFLDRPIPDRYLTASVTERAALALAFDVQDIPPLGHQFRLEVATTTKGFATDVTFFQIDYEGQRKHEWTVPKFVGARKRGKVLPALDVQSVSSPTTQAQTGS